MTLLNPLNAVRSALQTAIQLANKLVQRGVSGIRKRFSRKNFIKVEFIKLKDLKIDSKYQRLLNTNFIKNAGEFIPTLVKPLSVFLRPNGDYVVVDGQHTCVIAATYVEDPSEFELPCQVQVHPSDRTLEECLEAEAKYFKDFNSSRTNMTSVALLRADLAQGKKYAQRIEENFTKLKVQVELIGAEDDGTNSVVGYKGLRSAIGKYGLSYTDRAIKFYKRQNANTSFKGWKKIDGSMILGLTALFHLLDNVKGIDQKADDLTNYMVEHLCKKSVKEITNKTAGVLQDILIVERVLDWYNTAADVCSYVKIGTDKDNSILTQWKNDPVHNKKGTINSEENSEED
tara:strand:+ start:437 stop:1468 length:1032 start_codon:yes stop_codon:yes gene_type:complete